MQRGLGNLAAVTASLQRRCGHPAILLLALAAGGCVGTGEIVNLADARSATVAFASIEGAPPAVFHKLVERLEQEASGYQIAVVPAGQANYRLRGYLAADARDSSSIIWVLDVYDADERRAFRLRGEDKTAAAGWDGADEQVVGRIAAAGMQQFATFAAAAGTPAPAGGSAAPAPHSTGFGWLDDWPPEASGIFRIWRGGPSRPDTAADIGTALPADQVPLPRLRPAPTDAARTSTIAFAPENR